MLVPLLLLAVGSLEASPVANKSCIIENYTWTPENMLKIYFNLPNMAACGLKCAEQEECSGYTWHAPNTNLYYSYACTLFAAEDAYVPCTDCYSLSLRDYVVEGVCRAMEGGNLLGVDFAATSQDCAALCLAKDCRYWSWMGPPDFPHTQQMCVRYSSCPVVETCLSGQACMTGHRHAAVAQNKSASPEPCYNQSEESDKCLQLLVEPNEIVEQCFKANYSTYSLNSLGSLLPYNANSLVLVKDVVWSKDCFYNDLCWTYSLRHRTLNRPSLQGNFSLIIGPRRGSSFLAVGESLVLYGRNRDSYEVYNTVTETLSSVPVAKKADNDILCTVAINSVQFLSIEFEYNKGRQIKMFKYSIEGDGKVLEMPIFDMKGYSRSFVCVADSQFVYAVDSCDTVYKFNLEDETWTSIPLENRDRYNKCLGAISAPGEEGGVYIYSGKHEYSKNYVLIHRVHNETSQFYPHRLQYPTKMGLVHAAFTL